MPVAPRPPRSPGVKHPARLLYCLILLLPALAGATAGAPQPYIIGGSDAGDGDHPYMVSLVSSRSATNYDGHFCGGTLIAPRWVLTAGHCADPSRLAASTAVVTGTATLSTDNSGRTAVSAVLRHPGYNDLTLTDDLALLYLAGDVAQTPVTLATAADVAALVHGTDVTAIGWGRTDADGSEQSFPAQLQTVSLDFIPQAACEAAGYYGFAITPDQFCAGDLIDDSAPEVLGGAGICNGDSGGPLLHGDMQIGIASFGAQGSDCAASGIPDGFANVGHFRDWIDGGVYSADLGVTLTRRALTATRHELVAVVSNRSPANAANGALLRLTVAAGDVRFIESAPGCSGTPPDCVIDALPPGASVRLQLRVEAPAGSSWRVDAGVDWPGDNNAGNDSASVAVNIVDGEEPVFGGSGGSSSGLFLLLAGLAGLRRRRPRTTGT